MGRSEAQKRRLKYTAMMRERGTPMLVGPDELERLREHLTRLRVAGMGNKQVARSAPGGHDQTVVAKIIKGERTTVHRDVYTDLMQAQFVPPLEFRTGTLMSPVGLQRRVAALNVAGFSYDALGRQLGISFQAVQQLVNQNRPVRSSTMWRYSELYEKLCTADPLEFGMTPLGVKKTRLAAERRGCAPWWCWDSDTIEDPDAIPQWTGRCGTPLGNYIHKRDGVPMCGPCQEAGPMAGYPGFVPAKLAALRARRGMSVREVQDASGVHARTVNGWERGHYSPRQPRLDEVLSVLDATVEDVIDEEEESG